MRNGRYSETELRSSFENQLASVSSGDGLHSESGLDLETEEALRDIAAAYPNIGHELIDAARRAFGGQLDGSHAAARRATVAAMLEEFGRSTES